MPLCQTVEYTMDTPPECCIVETLDVPELEDVVDDHYEPGQPEEDRDEDEGLREEVHLGVGRVEHDLAEGELVVLAGRLVPEEEGVVDTLGHEHGEEDNEDELGKLEDFLKHHHREAVFLVVVIDLGWRSGGRWGRWN